MENASKALIMAASMLISLLIITLMVYLFVSFANTSKQTHMVVEANQLNQFNSQFTSYQGKEGITIYDVISVASLATENNKYYEIQRGNGSDKNNYVAIFRGTEEISYGTEKTSEDVKKRYNDIIENEIRTLNNTKLNEYECEVTISSITGRVNKVVFTQK